MARAKTKVGKFGGADYKPAHLGPEPAPEPKPAAAQESPKVAFSTRITLAADQQLKALSREEGRSTTFLVGEALNLLFKKRNKPEVA